MAAPPVASTPNPAIRTNRLETSWLRATWPFLRASSRRLGVGFSVRSALLMLFRAAVWTAAPCSIDSHRPRLKRCPYRFRVVRASLVRVRASGQHPGARQRRLDARRDRVDRECEREHHRGQADQDLGAELRRRTGSAAGRCGRGCRSRRRSGRASRAPAPRSAGPRAASAHRAVDEAREVAHRRHRVDRQRAERLDHAGHEHQVGVRDRGRQPSRSSRRSRRRPSPGS